MKEKREKAPHTHLVIVLGGDRCAHGGARAVAGALVRARRDGTGEEGGKDGELHTDGGRGGGGGYEVQEVSRCSTEKAQLKNN